MWRRCGGSVFAAYSLDWTRVLNPGAITRSRPSRASLGRLRPLLALARPMARRLDARLRRRADGRPALVEPRAEPGRRSRDDAARSPPRRGDRARRARGPDARLRRPLPAPPGVGARGDRRDRARGRAQGLHRRRRAPRGPRPPRRSRRRLRDARPARPHGAGAADRRRPRPGGSRRRRRHGARRRARLQRGDRTCAALAARRALRAALRLPQARSHRRPLRATTRSSRPSAAARPSSTAMPARPG